MGDILTFPVPQETRLRAALRSLEMAFSEQHIALTDFRQNIGELRGAVGSVSASLGTFRGGLDDVQRSVGEAQDAAHRLHLTADAASKA